MIAMTTVKLRYSASSNITFHGEIDTQIERQEWEEMSQKEQDEIISDVLFELIDIGEVPE